MLETIREFGAELLVAAGEEEALHQRHTRYFLGLAERAEPWLLTSGQFEWLECLETENDNLRAALASSLESRDLETSMRLASCLWCFWLIYGHVNEGWDHLSTVLAQPGAEDFQLEYAKLKVAAGAVAYFRGDHDRALELCAEGLPLCRAAGARFHSALALALLGGLDYFRGDFDQATSQWEESMALAEELGNRWLISVLLPVMGVLALHRGQHERSLDLCRQGLARAREVGENWSINQALYNAGLAYIGARDFGRARSCFLEGLAVSRSLNFYLGISLNLVGLAGIAVAQGDFERAARLLGAGDAATIGLRRLNLRLHRPRQRPARGRGKCRGRSAAPGLAGPVSSHGRGADVDPACRRGPHHHVLGPPVCARVTLRGGATAGRTP